MTVPEARECEAAESAGIVHMTASTYRFVPAMRYLAPGVERRAGRSCAHFRAQRFQDWGRRDLAWRQLKPKPAPASSATCSHRLDYGHHPIGLFARISARCTASTTRASTPLASRTRPTSTTGSPASARPAGRHRLPREHQGRQRPRRRRHRPRPLRNQRHRRQRQLSPRRSARRADGPQAAASSASRCPRASWSNPARRATHGAGDPLQAFRYDQTQRSSSRSSTARLSGRRSAPGSRRRS